MPGSSRPDATPSVVTRRKFIQTVLGTSAVILTSCSAPPPPAPTTAPAAPTAVPKPAAPPAAQAQATTAPAQAASSQAIPQKTPGDLTGARKGGTLTCYGGAGPVSFDMHQETSIATSVPVSSCYNQLVQYDPLDAARIVPDLAERWQIAQDGLSYTFFLRKGVKFHNGNDFTSDDVKFSFERQMNPPSGVLSPRRSYWSAVDKIETADPYTVRFLMKRPDAAFMGKVASGWSSVYSRKWVEGGGNPKTQIMGTGPFVFEEYRPDERLVVKRNPNYFIPDRPFLDGRVYHITRDQARQLPAFISGTYNWSGKASRAVDLPSKIEQVEAAVKGVVVQSYNSINGAVLWYNVRKPPMDNIKVRQAIDLALDRQTFLTAIIEDQGEIGGPMPPGQFGIPQDELMKRPGFRQPKGPDIDQAKRLLQEAGVAGGTPLVYVTRDLPHFRNQAVFAEEQLRAVGLAAKISILDTATYGRVQEQKDYHIAGDRQSEPLYDPDALLGAYTTDNNVNLSGISDPQLDQMFRDQGKELDPAKRAQMAINMQRRIMDLVPCSTLTWVNYNEAWWPQVRNYKPGVGHHNNLRMEDVWLAS